MVREYTVYKHMSPSGKVYIGITSKKPEYRWDNGNGYRHNKHFYSAILKYGWSNIKHEILFTGLTKEQAEAKEIELIKLFNSTDSRYGYNIESGGNANKALSEATKEKIRQATLGKRVGKDNPFYGKTHSKEVRVKLSIVNTGSHHSEETRAKMSLSHKGKKGYWTGKHHSKETREKISLGHHKPVIQKDKSGNIIATYHNCNYAQTMTGILHIDECCKGYRKTAGGYCWEYDTKELKEKQVDAQIW